MNTNRIKSAIFTCTAICAVFLVYISTACPTIYMGDAGEIVSASYTLGIGHPPGYPLSMMLGKIFMSFPAGDPAFMMNVLSAAAAVSALLMIYLFSAGLLKTAWNRQSDAMITAASAIAACIFAFSPLFWVKAAEAKGGIYMLAIFFMAASAYAIMLGIRDKAPRWYLLSAYLSGFALISHQTSALFSFAAVCFSIYKLVNDEKPGKALAAILLYLCAAATPYLYLLIRSAGNPAVNWGNIKGLADVINHILRTAYTSVQGTGSEVLNAESIMFKTNRYFSHISGAYNAALLLALAGFASLYARQKRTAVTLGLFLACQLLLLLAVTSNKLSETFSHVNKVFFLTSDFVLVPLFAAGIYSLAQAAKDKWQINRAFTALVISVLPALILLANYPAADKSSTFLGYDHGLNIIKTLPQGAALFAEKDCPVFNLSYMMYVKKIRPAPGAGIYDRSMVLLDKDIFAGTRLNDEKREKEIEAEQARLRPGNTFYNELYEIPGLGLRTYLFGIIYRLLPQGRDPAASAPIFSIYTLRDYYGRTGTEDVFNSEFLAKYLLARARYYLYAGKLQPAESLIKTAEKISGSNSEVLSIITATYLYEIRDLAKSAVYAEKLYMADRTNINSLDILARLSLMQGDLVSAEKWLAIALDRITDEDMKKSIRARLYEIRQLRLKAK